MPQHKRFKNILLAITILSIVSVITFLLFPKFQLKAEGDPQLVDLVLSTDTVNTYDGVGDQTVTIWARLSTGTATEIDSATATLVVPFESSADDIQSAMTLLVGEGTCDAIEINKVGIVGCGDATDGIYVAELTFPKPSPMGEWGVHINFVDNDTNEADYPPSLTLQYVTNTTDTEDTTPPEIVDWYFLPETINTENADVEITMYARLSDDISGLSHSYDQTFTLQAIGVTENDNYYTIDFELNLMTNDEACALLDVDFKDGLDNTCGDEMDGIYTATTTLNRYSPKGTWKVGRIPLDPPEEGYDYSRVGNLEIRDNADNSLTTSNDATIDISFTNTATIHDITAPELVSLTMTPTTFNSNIADQTITVKMNVKDDLSGVVGANIYISPLIPGGPIRPPDEYNVVGSSIKDGEISFDIVIEKGSKTGLWVIDQIGIWDRIGNRKDTTGLKRLSFAFPNLELFLVNQAITSEVLIEEDWYIEEWDDYVPGFYLTHPLMSIKFQEGTVVTKKEGGSFAFHRMLTRKYDMSQYTDISNFITEVNQQLNTDLQDCDSSEGCFDAQLNTNNLAGDPINIIKMGIPGLNLSFSKPVIISLAMDDEYLGTTFVIQTFNHETNEWTNETTCLVKTIEPSSYEHGGGPDGFFKPGPYTACQFETDHATFFSTNILGESTSQAGVPNTGLGGLYNYFTRWLR